MVNDFDMKSFGQLAAHIIVLEYPYSLDTLILVYVYYTNIISDRKSILSCYDVILELHLHGSFPQTPSIPQKSFYMENMANEQNFDNV